MTECQNDRQDKNNMPPDLRSRGHKNKRNRSLTFYFITLMFIYLQKLLHCLIICSYKTNPSFSSCPFNLRSIGPSDFKISTEYSEDLAG